MPKEFIVDTAVVLVGLVGWLISWLVIYWRRDTKRERVRFAREQGRKICPCSETGEIMVVRTKHIEAGGLVQQSGDHDFLVCPKCEAWTIPDEMMARDRKPTKAA